MHIDAVYDGEDLAEVARLTGLSAEGVIAAHTGQIWTVAFGGFAPGFGYMVGENQVLEVPRRSSPRTAVPAGSVALAGNYSAVYPRKSPGGWQLIGRTAARMWDLGPRTARPGRARRPGAVPAPCAELVKLRHRAPAARYRRQADRTRTSQSGLRILSPGLQSLIQDLGRPGHAGWASPPPERWTVPPCAAPTGSSATAVGRRRRIRCRRARACRPWGTRCWPSPVRRRH